jgi:outer membrane protein TolC
LKTAAQQVKTARDLYASAQQSEDVALGRYKAGVGSILDLLTAQTAFANARAQEVQARANWFLAMAQLAHDTGSLAPPAGREPAASLSTKGSTASP